MDIEEFFKRYQPLIKRHWLPLLLGLFGLIFLSYGLIVLLAGSGNSQDLSLQQSEDLNLDSEVSPVASGADIMVDIEGSVLKPGVYALKRDARLQDGLIAAGGLSEIADRSWVAKNLNLAMRLTDAAKVYIPSIGESAVAVNNQGVVDAERSLAININGATASELDKLTGVGPATAQKIIEGRPYNSVTDLVSKKILSQKAFDKIKDRISVF